MLGEKKKTCSFLKIQALTRFMLPVGDPLKDSGNSEEAETKKQVRKCSPVQGYTQEIKIQGQTGMENNGQLWYWAKCCVQHTSTSSFQ